MIEKARIQYIYLENKYPRLSKLSRYLLSGFTATAIDLGLLYFLTEFFSIWYLFSAIVSFVVSFIVSFILQKFWTFKDKNKDKIHSQMIIYLIITLTNLLVNIFLLFVGVEYLGLHYMLAQFLISGFIAVSNFFLYRYVVFSGIK
mgnify:CR=1 FL=1